MVDILAQVNNSLLTSGPAIKERVVKELTEVELDKRAELILKAIQKHDQMNKDVHKMRPDVKTIDPTSGEEKSVWSKDAHDKFKKAQEELDKLGKQIEKCFGENVTADDYNKLKGIVGN